jgi:hypothetical protein
MKRKKDSQNVSAGIGIFKFSHNLMSKSVRSFLAWPGTIRVRTSSQLVSSIVKKANRYERVKPMPERPENQVNKAWLESVCLGSKLAVNDVFAVAVIQAP